MLPRGPIPSCSLAVIIGALLLSPARADDGSSTAAKPPTEVVMFVSEELFDDLTADSLELNLTIDQTQEGARFTGEGNAIARTTIDLLATPDATAFEVQISADAETNLHIDAGPASANAQTLSQVTATRRLMFDGVKFTPGEIDVDGESQTRILQVCSRRGGLVGRIVRRVAGRQLSEKRPRINSAVNDYVADFTREEISTKTNQLIVELNQTTPLEETIMAAFPETKDWIYYVTKTDDYIRADAGPRGARLAELPAEEMESDEVPIEVWIHLRPAEKVMASLLLKWNRAHDLLKQFLPEEEAALLADDVSYDMLQSWLRIRVGAPAVERALAK